MHSLHFLLWGLIIAYVSGDVKGFCSGKPNGNYVDPENCNGFIQCSSGYTYHTPCNPASLRYNINCDCCDWPENVKCVDQKGKPPTPPPPPTTVHPPLPTLPPSFGCGIDKKRTISEIIGGTEARPNRWIWQIGLYDDDKFVCGGSLINTDTVVTAAHCVDSRVEYSMTVKVGDHDRGRVEGTEQTVAVKAIITHDGWSRRTIANDIAILKLEKKFTLNNNAGTICLPEPNAIPPKDAKCYITGWGKTDIVEDLPDRLQEAELPILTNAACGARNKNNDGKSSITDKMVCAGFTGPDTKISGCKGDSGGPLFCKGEKEQNWVLQGIVSWGSRRCDAQHRYTVFTRVSKYVDWILSAKPKSYPDP